MVSEIILAVIAFYNQVDMFGEPQYMKHVIPKSMEPCSLHQKNLV